MPPPLPDARAIRTVSPGPTLPAAIRTLASPPRLPPAEPRTPPQPAATSRASPSLTDRQPSAPLAFAGSPQDDLAILAAAGLSPHHLAAVADQAALWGVPPRAAALSLGYLCADAYVEALARLIGGRIATHRTPMTRHRGSAGQRVELIDATTPAPIEVARQCHLARASGGLPLLVATSRLQDHEQPAKRRRRLVEAIGGLRRRRPEVSAGRPAWIWQPIALTMLAGMLTGALAVAPEPMSDAILLGLAVPFFCIVVLRLAALAILVGRGTSGRHRQPPTLADADLPTYAILVPLYGEARSVPSLVQALTRLNYPAAKLDIILILEASDIETRTAVELISAPPTIRSIVVPDSQPRTKPKALNFALGFARGDVVVVFDAEDVPEPDQLRRAAALAAASGPDLGCIQACLNIDNPAESWLTRQFALEYTALFDGVLPALARLGVPVPLGGTSNHFPRRVLEAAGGWDPFNVTEDAELGIRLARDGYRVEVLTSTTWEEAPIDFRAWLGQRTRWIKGWMQTWLVHMRQPVRVARELGPGGFIALQALMGGLILSALLHPVVYVALAFELASATPFARPHTLLGQSLWAVTALNLAAGYLSAMLLAAVTAARRGWWGLALHIVFMPIYWLAISVAAYRALFELVRAPHRWEKTAHGLSRRHAALRR